MTDAATRLAALLEADPAPLDRAMAVVASLSATPPDEDWVVAELDRLAAGLHRPASGPPSADAVITHTFGQLGFAGNTANYYSPVNSFIHWVLEHRRGIPLTLAAVASEIGRRHGVDLSIVGLPGHVIVGEGRQPQRWFDPFAGGAGLDVEGCRQLFARFHPVEAFDQAMLQPIGATLVVARMLTNLKLVYRRLGDLGRLARAAELAVAVPGNPLSERYELAAVLGALGRDEQAAAQYDQLVALDPPRAADHRRAAHRHRARRN